jgi:hypothetical protein
MKKTDRELDKNGLRRNEMMTLRASVDLPKRKRMDAAFLFV